MTLIEPPWTKRTRWTIAIGYVLCWVVGLGIGGPSLTPHASAAEVTAAFAGSLTLLAFGVLVHGVAAILLALLGRSLASGRAKGAVFPLACAAAGLSIVQFVGEVSLVTLPSVPDAASVWEVITRVDGVKMLVLAALIAVVHGGRDRERVTLTIISAAAVLALLLSGIGYLVLLPELMSAATASLPLLLIWALAATAARVVAASPPGGTPTGTVPASVTP
jgi:hypothetical protein